MAQGGSIYRRLTGKKRHLGGYTQLWLAPDHLLLLRSTYFTQEYRRFALSEIQAIVATERPESMVLIIVCGLLAIGSFYLAYVLETNFSKIFWAIIAMVILAVAFSEIVRGQRCRCYLHTAVSRELLEPVSRMSKAQKFLDQIQPAIEGVQGQLQPVSVTVAPELPAAERPPEVPNAPGFLPEIIFGLFLADALLVAVDYRFPAARAGGALVTTFFAEFILAAFALFRRDPRPALIPLIGLSLAGIGVDLYGVSTSFAAWIYQVFDNARHGIAANSEFTWSPSLRAVLISSGWRTVIGGTGMILALVARRKERRV